jgi:circadian clock protein KaiC
MSPIQPPAATGIAGLDDILGGGFARDRLYVIEGMPGTGKTTLALQFLIEGARRGEPVLYVTLSETEEEIRAVAASHGWSFQGVSIRELTPSEALLEPDEQYSVFHPADVELNEATREIVREVERIKPMRVVVDSVSELRLLADSALRYRQQILALKQFFSGRHSTVLLLDDLTVEDRDLQTIVHGVVSLGHTTPDYGVQRRRVQVLKYRGTQFRSGFHDYAIRRGGLEVFPRLVAAEHAQLQIKEPVSSGVPELDALLGGGIERATSTLILGVPGTGKSTLASLFVAHAAAQGDSATIYTFDERTHTLLARTDGIGIDLRQQVEAGRVKIREVDPAELSPGEFVQAIRQAVEEDGSSIVVIDSLNGYLKAMPDEQFLTVQLHELFTYLAHRGVATLLVAAQHGLIGSQMVSAVDASYLADAIILLRYFEFEGEVRQAISVLKKRSGRHERTIREFRLAPGKVTFSEPLRDYHGVLTGVPERKTGT